MKTQGELSGILVERVEIQGGLDTIAAEAVVCEYLSLASVRIASDFPLWESGYSMAQHNKVIMADDAAFYMGSMNLYPTLLQEFGFIVEDAEAAAELKRDMLDPLWEYSQEAASINPAIGFCNLTSTSGLYF